MKKLLIALVVAASFAARADETKGAFFGWHTDQRAAAKEKGVNCLVAEAYTEGSAAFTIATRDTKTIVVKGQGLDKVETVQLELFKDQEVTATAPLTILDKAPNLLLAVWSPIPTNLVPWVKGPVMLNAKPYGNMVEVKVVEK